MGIVYNVSQRIDESSFRKTEKLIARQAKETAELQAKHAARAEAARLAAEAAISAMKQEERQARRLAKSLSDAQQLGMIISAAGASILAPFALSIKEYLSSADEADAIAARWNASMNSLRESAKDVGRVMIDELNPALEKAAELIGQAASFIEKNPKIGSSIMRIGAGLAGGGAIFAGLTNVAKTLAQNEMMGGASAFTKLSQVTVMATSVYLGAETGLAIGNAINRALGRDEQTWGDVGRTAAQALSLPFLGAAKLLKDAGFDKASEKLHKFTMATYEAVTATRKAATAIKQSKDEIAKTGAALASENMRSGAGIDRVKEAERLRAEINKQLAQQERAQATVVKLREKQLSEFIKFQQAEADAANRYNLAVSAARNQTRQQERQAERNHQAALAKIRRDGKRAETQATRDRDALALEEAKRNTAEQVKEENQRYSEERLRLREALNTRLRELAANYDAERNRRLKEFEYANQMRKLEIEAAQRMVTQIAQILANGMGYVNSAAGQMAYYARSNAAPLIYQSGRGGYTTRSATANINLRADGLSARERRILAGDAAGVALSALERAFAEMR